LFYLSTGLINFWLYSRREHLQERLITLNPSLSLLDNSFKLACPEVISADLKNGCCGGRNREEGSQGLEARGPKALLDTGLTVPEKLE
jgi:hypothetical protein